MAKLSQKTIDEIIILYQSGETPKNIGEKFNIRNNSVTRILRRNNIPRTQNIRLEKDEIKKICQNYLDGYNSEELAKLFNKHPTTICKVLKKNNIKIRDATDNKRRYFLNEDWLDEIDSEEKAYFIGLFLADGNISKSKNDISLRLHSKDKKVLEKLSEYFYKENRVSSYVEDTNKTSTPVSKLCIYSQRMKAKLADLGLEPNKCKTVEMPHINDNLLPHFIRGLLDGDGCICIRANGRVTVDFTGNQFIIGSLQKILEKRNVFCSVYYSEKKDSWSLQINRKLDIEKFLDWVYQNSFIHIERKYKLYEKVRFNK